MKNTTIYTGIFVAALSLGLASCQNDLDDLLTAVDNDDTSTFTTFVTLTGNAGSSSQTRAQLMLDNEDSSTEYFLWNEGDALSLYNVSNYSTTLDSVPTTFTISSDYSDDSPSNSASFSGYVDFAEGDTIYAIYPVHEAASGSLGDITYELPAIISLESNSDEEIKAYMASYMYMKGQFIFSHSGSNSIDFMHLTSIIRISYTNATSTDQAITSIKVAGDDNYFSTERNTDLSRKDMVLTGGNTSEMCLTFTDNTVPAGSTEEYYLIFFTGEYFNDGGALTFSINDQSISLSTDSISSNYLCWGYRYKFNITQTDDGLTWTNHPEEEEIEDAIIYATDNATLCTVLAKKLSDVTLDDDGNAIIPGSVIKSTTSLNLHYQNLTKLDGLECFIYLEELDCGSNSFYTLDMSSFPALTHLECDGCKLTSLNVSSCTALTYLDCDDNDLTSLDVTNCPLLQHLNCEYNELSSIDLSNCPELTYLDLYSNNLTSIDMSNNMLLETVDVALNSSLDAVDLSDHAALTSLNCLNDKSIVTLNLANCSSLSSLTLPGGATTYALASADFTNCSSLTSLTFQYLTYFASLNLTGCTGLTSLTCFNNKALTSIDVSDCTALQKCTFEYSKFTSIDLSKNENLTSVYCDNNSLLTSLVLPTETVTLTTLACYYCQLSTLDISNCPITTLNCGYQYDENGKSGNNYLTLYVTEDQYDLWESKWSSQNLNSYVNAVVASSSSSSTDGSTSDSDTSNE